LRSDQSWRQHASQDLKSALAKKGAGYATLVELLQQIGVSETYASIANKVSRGTFSHVFYLQCLRAIERIADP
jgi:hypothetical protein